MSGFGRVACQLNFITGLLVLAMERVMLQCSPRNRSQGEVVIARIAQTAHVHVHVGLLCLRVVSCVCEGAIVAMLNVCDLAIVLSGALSVCLYADHHPDAPEQRRQQDEMRARGAPAGRMC
jgi:hypothetical protein